MVKWRTKIIQQVLRGRCKEKNFKTDSIIGTPKSNIVFLLLYKIVFYLNYCHQMAMFIKFEKHDITHERILQ